MVNLKKIKKQRERRKRRVRYGIKISSDRPMLTIYISNRHIYAQIVDVESGKTLVYASTLDKEFPVRENNRKSKECARQLGAILGKRAIKKGIKKVVLNRGYKKYHGRIKEFCDAMREAGVQF
jgi:large subunit ribosomal protein L18